MAGFALWTLHSASRQHARFDSRPLNGEPFRRARSILEFVQELAVALEGCNQKSRVNQKRDLLASVLTSAAILLGPSIGNAGTKLL